MHNFVLTIRATLKPNVLEVKNTQETLICPKKRKKVNALQETLQITEAVARK